MNESDEKDIQSNEREMVEAMYPDEFNSIDERSFRLQFDSSCELTIRMPSGYPSRRKLEVRVSSRRFSNARAELLQKTANDVIQEHAQRPCVCEVIENVVEAIRCLEDEDEKVKPSTNAEIPRVTALLLLIDHMNDRLAYLKRLRNWFDELEISGTILLRVDGRRAKHIVCFLHAMEENVNEFLTRLRTQKMSNVDVREKQSSVLWRSRIENMKLSHPTVVGMSTYRTWAELESSWGRISTSAIVDWPSFTSAFGVLSRKNECRAVRKKRMKPGVL